MGFISHPFPSISIYFSSFVPPSFQVLEGPLAFCQRWHRCHHLQLPSPVAVWLCVLMQWLDTNHRMKSDEIPQSFGASMSFWVWILLMMIQSGSMDDPVILQQTARHWIIARLIQFGNGYSKETGAGLEMTVITSARCRRSIWDVSAGILNLSHGLGAFVRLPCGSGGGKDTAALTHGGFKRRHPSFCFELSSLVCCYGWLWWFFISECNCSVLEGPMDEGW